MTNKQNTIKILFNINFSYKFPTSSVEDIIEYLSDIIPHSGSYYRYVGDKYGASLVKDAQEEGLRQEEKGNTLYLFNDDPDVVHWFAMHKDYYPLIRSLKKFLNYQFAESFNAIDMTEY